MTRFLAGFLAGIATFYAFAIFLSATPDTETAGNGEFPWPIGV